MKSFIALVILLVFAVPGFAQPLDVTDAWIKNLPPAMPMRAGYMTLMNYDNKVTTIVSVRSDAFKNVSIHKTVSNSGVMSMVPIKKLVIEPNQTVALKPGGMHLMLMKPTRALAIGDDIKVMLEFNDGASQTILMQVKK